MHPGLKVEVEVEKPSQGRSSLPVSELISSVSPLMHNIAHVAAPGRFPAKAVECSCGIKRVILSRYSRKL